MSFSPLNTTLVAIFSLVIFINKAINLGHKVDGFGEKDFSKICKRIIYVQVILIKKFCLEPKTLLSSEA